MKHFTSPTRLIVCFFVLFVMGTQAEAGERPSFRQRYSAWHATDIVVVNANGVVLETWKGELQPDTHIPLAEMALPQSPSVSYRLTSKKKGQHEAVSGDRMVLFLIRKETSEDKVEWKPAVRFGDMKVSVAWIEDTHAYAFVQRKNTGPTELVPLNQAEEKLKQTVNQMVRVQHSLRRAAKTKDANERAKQLVNFVNSNIQLCRQKAFRLLSECGEEALPHLRELLQDQSKLELHDEAIKALGTAGGEAVVPKLTAIVKQELAFWKKRAPELKVGWWNGKGLEWKQVEHLRNRYSVALQIFHTLRKIKSPVCKAAVKDFRDYWSSLPQLGDKDGLDQMTQACNAVLKELPRESSKKGKNVVYLGGEMNKAPTEWVGKETTDILPKGKIQKIVVLRYISSAPISLHEAAVGRLWTLSVKIIEEKKPPRDSEPWFDAVVVLKSDDYVRVTFWNKYGRFVTPKGMGFFNEEVIYSKPKDAGEKQ